MKSILLALALLPVTTLWGAENVTVTESPSAFTLDNGIVTARVSRSSGDLLSLKYQGLEMLDNVSQHQPGYWSHNTARGRQTARITIDPGKNGGERGEISIQGFADGKPIGSGPGGSVIADIEIRYALARGDSAVYTYSILSHPTNYPATSLGEARFCLKLNDDLFDWMTVDSHRNMQMLTAYDWNHGTPMNLKEARLMTSGIYRGQVEHKYDYAVNQFTVRTWGWQSSTHHVGVWFINPSVEYLSGGPTKFELSAHRDATFTDSLTAAAPPTLLNYWRSSHYGGSVCDIAATDNWTKVVGPFLIYCNSGPTRDAAWTNAVAREKTETAAWPFDWVAGTDYPHQHERSSVSGVIVLQDREAPNLVLSNLRVGLAAPDYLSSALPESTIVGWQNDAKFYEFWAPGDAQGRFSIPNVRPGVYTLHAIADGVLGELAVSNITVTAGKPLELGRLNWQPVRYGKQLWDIGIPNRNASEFFDGDDYFHWGWYLKYPKLFPNDVDYVIGKSDVRKDWFFEQVPHHEDLTNTNGRSRGRATTWTVDFQLPEVPRGAAILRLAICGVGARDLSATVNGQPVGHVTNLVYNAVINRDGISGSWCERDLTFDASLMKSGANNLKLTIPGGGLTSGIMYDYLRLELNQSPRENISNH